MLCLRVYVQFFLLFCQSDFSTCDIMLNMKDCMVDVHNGMSIPGSGTQYRYHQLRKHSNCKVLKGSLEIVYMEDRAYNFSFLNRLQEVGGYILINHVRASVIDLSNLEIIRGEEPLHRYSLYIQNSEIGSLKMPKIRGIIQGGVRIANNVFESCYIRTINWNDVLASHESKVSVSSDNTTASCKCHPSCSPLGGCWGPSRRDCQHIVRANCDSCGKSGCYLRSGHYHCCNDQCAGGCSSEGPAGCRGCINFRKEGKCVASCNADDYDRSRMVKKNVRVMYTLGSDCVYDCGRGLLTEDFKCVTQCSKRNMIRGNRCEECHGCNKTCTFNNRYDREFWADVVNCTELTSSLEILQHINKFDVHNRLRLMSHLKTIGNKLVIQLNSPSFRNFDYLKSIEVIRGGLEIHSTSLVRLDLRSLKRIVHGDIVIKNNPYLCYAGTINWKRYYEDVSHANTVVENNRNQTECERRGHKCHIQCSDEGCWGNTDTDCVTCRYFTFTHGGVMKCVSNCSGTYGSMFQSSSNACDICHPQCVECDGPLLVNCTSCRHLRGSRGLCVTECEANEHAANRTCFRCHPACRDSCTGGGAFRGLGGCDRCLLEKPLNSSHSLCLLANASCGSGFYKERFGCRPCNQMCRACTTSGTRVDGCTCRDYVQQNHCVSACSEGHYVNTSGVCEPCNQLCSSCAISALNCTKCRYYKTYLADNTTFNCSQLCPPNHATDIDSDEPGVCKPVAFHLAMPIGVSLLALATATVIVFAIICKRRIDRRHELIKMALMMQKEGVTEPLHVTDTQPNLAQLRIVKENELRRGDTLGYGAFGRVYKGVWLPAGEDLKVPVAIKVLHEGTCADANRHMLDEACIMASLAHSHVLPLLAVCLSSRRLMLVSQLMPLGSLLEYVRRHRAMVGSKPLLNWCVQIARGMQYLERRRLVHRDLAARNVLVHTPLLVKICDFGLARMLETDSVEYRSAEGGKMPIKWLAVESIRQQIFTHKSDVWSYGVTVWEILTYGEKPYEGVAVHDVLHVLEKGERLQQPRFCSIDVYLLIVQCWLLDPASRPDFHQLVEAFARMCADPGRYLVIPGDRFMRLPTYTQQDEKDLIRVLAASALDDGSSGEELVTASDYIHSNSDEVFAPDFNTGVTYTNSCPRYTVAHRREAGRLQLDEQLYLRPQSPRRTTEEEVLRGGEGGGVSPLLCHSMVNPEYMLTDTCCLQAGARCYSEQKLAAAADSSDSRHQGASHSHSALTLTSHLTPRSSGETQV